jgi:CRISPR system Cascade subunit CasB
MKSESIDRFVEALHRLAERRDRGALAGLRRGIGRHPGTVAEASRVVLPMIPSSLRRGRDLVACWEVATLFALHPTTRSPELPKNMGGLLRELSRVTASGGPDRLIVALLNAHREDLAWHLRRAVLLARDEGLDIDHRQLLYDLRYWEHPDRFVQSRWSLAYWDAESPPDPEPEAPS